MGRKIMSKRYIKEDIDRFYDYDLSISNREIYIAEIDELMSERVIKGVKSLKAGDEVLFTINSPGGDFYEGMAIYSAIKRYTEEYGGTIMNGTGHVMSMGTIIFQAAQYRYLDEHCTMMLHYGSAATGGWIHAKDFIQDAKEEQRLSSIMERIYLKKIKVKHPKFTLKDLREKMNFNWYLSAKEAVKWGLADGILGVDDADES